METIYSCPMHPEVHELHPGSCPVCGMALEPVIPQSDEDEEFLNMSRRFWATLPLSILVFFFSFFPNIPYQDVVSAILSSCVVLWGGFPFFKRGLESFLRRKLNMFSLISLGVGTAYIYSLVALLFPSIFPSSFQREGKVELYFEAATVITSLVLLGQVLEMKARKGTRMAIKALLGLSPKMATVIRKGVPHLIPLEEVHVKDLLRVKPGEKVPVDGVIVEGTGVVDESMVTGEAIPSEKGKKDKVIGGTLNVDGSFIMEALRVGKDTLLSQIVHMVFEAGRSKAKSEKLADTISSYFVPCVVLIAISTFLIWGIWGPSPSFAYGLINAVCVLIVACPCALGLATPMSIMVGLGKGAQSGVLIKNAEVFEELQQVDTLVSDKTGTLTEGKPRLSKIISLDTKEDVLLLAASISSLSQHPLSQAIEKKAKNDGLSLLHVDDFHSIPGKGIVGKVHKKKLILGNEKLLLDESIPLIITKMWDEQGMASLYLAFDGRLIGVFLLQDTIKSSTLKAIQLLKNEHIRLVMVTGDNKLVASLIAKALGISEYYAEVLPQEKNKIVKKLQDQGHKVAMAGDGINDAPALALANVGIAMGTGTDIAIESAGVTLMKGDLMGIIRARRLSKATVRNIKQNLFFAFFYNSLGIPLAAGVLYPFFGILLNPLIASLAMTLSSLSVVWNARRLLYAPAL